MTRMAQEPYKVEKVASPTCEKCGSVYVMVTKVGIECDNCDKPNVRSTKLEVKIERCDKIYRKTKEKVRNEVK
jgi:hypothetical protein